MATLTDAKGMRMRNMEDPIMSSNNELFAACKAAEIDPFMFAGVGVSPPQVPLRSRSRRQRCSESHDSGSERINKEKRRAIYVAEANESDNNFLRGLKSLGMDFLLTDNIIQYPSAASTSSEVKTSNTITTTTSPGAGNEIGGCRDKQNDSPPPVPPKPWRFKSVFSNLASNLTARRRRSRIQSSTTTAGINLMEMKLKEEERNRGKKEIHHIPEPRSSLLCFIGKDIEGPLGYCCSYCNQLRFPQVEKLTTWKTSKTTPPKYFA